ncbi:hypothetical protein Leryth_003059 [Lithospermum erythrorhizon]|nr:hypothetical protein Leryth_003059 [Lithospermum erythrorhizon]
MIEKVKGRLNPLVNLSTREELVHVAGYGEEKLSTVIITGQVRCLSSRVDAQGHQLPQPISGASVVVLCGHGKKKKEWASSITDAYGDFFIDLPSHLHAIPNLEKFCYVIVNKIPRNNKNMLNCINNSSLTMPKKHKRRNIKLISIDDGIRTYTTESIQIISKPNTHDEARKIIISSN